jgi:ElaB/YqjD/DUF883 family membrane-anchored ribosome-binding protein
MTTSTIDQAQDTLSAVRAKADELKGAALHRASEIKDAVASRASSLKDDVVVRAGDARGAIERLVQERPYAVMGGVLVAGLAIGLLMRRRAD